MSPAGAKRHGRCGGGGQGIAQEAPLVRPAALQPPGEIILACLDEEVGGDFNKYYEHLPTNQLLGPNICVEDTHSFCARVVLAIDWGASPNAKPYPQNMGTWHNLD